MKRAFALIGLVFLILPSLSHAEGWMRTYGGAYRDYANWVEPTSDGGYILSADYGLDEHNCALYLVKTDSVGDTLWTRLFYGETPSGTNWGECVQETSDGGYIMPGELMSDACLIKVDSYGDSLWTRTYEEGLIGYCVRQTQDGGYIITGDNWLAEPRSQTDLWLLRTDAEGVPLWSHTYGEDNDDRGCSLQLTPDGGSIITGFKGIPLVQGGRGTRVWLLKTDEQGDTMWTRAYAYDESDTIPSEQGYSVELTPDGGYIISGVADFNPFGRGVLWLLKTDAKGDTQWTQVYDYGQFGEFGKSVKQTKDGGYIIVGAKNYNMAGYHDLWLLKTDSTGDTLWTRTYGNGLPSDEGRCIQLTKDGGYIIAGFTNTYSAYGGPDIWLIKTDSMGFAGVSEESKVKRLEIDTPIGRSVKIRYSNYSQGFHAEVFDASGRKVDELHSNLVSGTVTWGEGFNPGVYFIVLQNDNELPQKVVLIR